jgi:hypothetical protein
VTDPMRTPIAGEGNATTRGAGAGSTIP